MANSQRKVIVRRFSGELLAGYLPPAAFVRTDSSLPRLDLLDLSGRVLTIQLADIKTISYVRDFNLADSSNPERLSRRTFLARPRSEGLWIRVTFRSGDLLEGLAPTDLSLVTSIIEDSGLHLVPPDTRLNTQRIFVPRAAISSLQILAVVTTPSRKKTTPPFESSILQDTLFPQTGPEPD
jgi:hypothetical protein